MTGVQTCALPICVDHEAAAGDPTTIGIRVKDCLNAKLIVEVDGNQHGFDDNREKDAKRTSYLASQGFSVLRFSNREVMTEMNGVLEAIYSHLNSTPTPNPSPQGGGEQSGAQGTMMESNAAQRSGASG